MKILIWKWSDGNKKCISVTKQCWIFNSLLICIYYDKFTPCPSLSNIPSFILIVRSKNNLTKIFFYIYRRNKETIKDSIIVEKSKELRWKNDIHDDVSTDISIVSVQQGTISVFHFHGKMLSCGKLEPRSR